MNDDTRPSIPTQFVSPDAETAADFPRETFGPRASFPPQHDRPDDAPERDAEAVEATPAAAAPNSEASGPEPLAAGTYSVYDDQHGGFMLVFATREGEVHRKHLPAHLVKMAEKLAGGNNPLKLLLGA